MNVKMLKDVSKKAAANLIVPIGAGVAYLVGLIAIAKLSDVSSMEEGWFGCFSMKRDLMHMYMSNVPEFLFSAGIVGIATWLIVRHAHRSRY